MAATAALVMTSASYAAPVNTSSQFKEFCTSVFDNSVPMVGLEDEPGETELGEEILTDPCDELKSNLVDYAKKFLGRPYRWGAKGPKAFDCSGLTGYVYKNFGLNIGGNSRHQAVNGQKIKITEANPGDLMFFSGRRGGRTVGHVGMVVEVDSAAGTLKFIHASTKRGVTIQKFPDHGYYSRHFLHAKRMIDHSSHQELASSAGY